MPRQFHAKVRSRKFNWTRKSCAQMFQVRADNAIANADYPRQYQKAASVLGADSYAKEVPGSGMERAW